MMRTRWFVIICTLAAPSNPPFSLNLLLLTCLKITRTRTRNRTTSFLGFALFAMLILILIFVPVTIPNPIFVPIPIVQLNAFSHDAGNINPIPLEQKRTLNGYLIILILFLFLINKSIDVDIGLAVHIHVHKRFSRKFLLFVLNPQWSSTNGDRSRIGMLRHDQVCKSHETAWKIQNVKYESGSFGEGYEGGVDCVHCIYVECVGE
mmetsp:Transcript_10859/g.16266  ORF Transcript_10859/g.16266 Transcript_10859/m.16266 type:complete len:206 (+) Transcript_10859:1105-1722(+)